MGDKVESFEQLRTWQDSIELSVQIYKLTSTFPTSEQYGITNQLRRASTSISANIAEGFGRNTNKDKIRFYVIAYGSVLEVKSFLYLCERLEYINHDQLVDLIDSLTSLQKMINASKRALHG